jgi:hypothetical protein
MTVSPYAQALEALQREVAKEHPSVLVVDDLIATMSADVSESLLHDLLLSLTDGVDSDDAMFSLVHAAEAFDDRAYISAILALLSQLSSVAPRWTSILLSRILNNPSSKAELVAQLSALSEKARGDFIASTERLAADGHLIGGLRQLIETIR